MYTCIMYVQYSMYVSRTYTCELCMYILLIVEYASEDHPATENA